MVAVIVPDLAFAADWAKAQGVENDLGALLQNAAFVAALRDALEQLRAGMRQNLSGAAAQMTATREWCSVRQFFVSLEEGAYTSVASAVPLLSLREAAVGEDGDASVYGPWDEAPPPHAQHMSSWEKSSSS